jgi:AraC-like DNA-binding protein
MIIEVEPGIVESFLGRIEDPQKAKNAAINIIDDPAFRIIMVVQQSSKSVADLHEDNQLPFFEVLQKFDGKIVRQTGNNLLASFKSVTNAVHASFAMSAVFKKTGSNKGILKIGISGGAPVTKETSLFASAVKVAERMCDVAKGEIIITSEVKDLFNSENSTLLKEGKNIRCIIPPLEKFLNALIDYTEKNWRNADLRIDDLGKALGCSRSQLYRNMISLSGHSPNTFIRSYRLNKALALLDKKSKNVSEVALETGFSNVSYFSKCFHKKYGYLPSHHSAVVKA